MQLAILTSDRLVRGSNLCVRYLAEKLFPATCEGTEKLAPLYSNLLTSCGMHGGEQVLHRELTVHRAGILSR